MTTTPYNNNHKLLEHHTNLLSLGDEKGLTYFYNLYSRRIYGRALLATGDVCHAESIVQECFLKLWMLRGNIEEATQVLELLRKQVKSSVSDFFKMTKHRFNRNLLRIDGIEGFEKYLSDRYVEDDDEDGQEALYYQEQYEEEQKQQMDRVRAILPSLCSKQRLFLDLCLRYSFSYERVAAHLGGISEYAVAKKTEEVIAKLKGLLDGIGRIDAPDLRARMVLSDGLSEQQQDILRIRHELGLTFDEIAEQISLPSNEVRRLFLEAHLTVTKKTG